MEDGSNKYREFFKPWPAPTEPSYLELRLADAISRNSPYRVFAALDAVALALSRRPFDSSERERIRSIIYPLLCDIRAGHNRGLEIYLPQEIGLLRLDVRE